MTFKRLAWLTPFVLPVAGCILIASAAFTVALWAGLLASGVAAFFLEWRIDAERSQR